MNNENKEFILRWYDEVWNKGNENAISEMFHPEGKAYGLGPEPLVGDKEFIKFYRSFNESLGQFKIEVDMMLFDGNFVTAMCTVNAHYKKTNKSVSFKGVSIAEVQNGQLINGWNYFDFLGLNLQLGNITQDQLL